MSDQRDQQPQDSPAQHSTGEKSDYRETMSDHSSYDRFLFPANNKYLSLKTLQYQAYNDVLRAFIAESPTMSTEKILILRDFMSEWNISHQTHAGVEKEIKSEPLVKNLSELSDEKGKGNVSAVKIKPLRVQEKAGPSSGTDDSHGLSWGGVSPESLVGKGVGIRLPGENGHISFYVAGYEAETGMHHLTHEDSLLEFEDPCDWIDLRHVPAEDMIWQEKPPAFQLRRQRGLKGESLLNRGRKPRQQKPKRNLEDKSPGSGSRLSR